MAFAPAHPPRPIARPAPPETLDEARAVIAAFHAKQGLIALTIHDTLCQTLTGAYLHAKGTVRKLEANGSEAAADVAHLTEMLHQAVIELGEVVRMLQPEPEKPSD